MDNRLPNPIKEYYIAYFDVLGYQAFFKETPDKASEFLTIIHSAITNTVNYLKSLKDSPLASQFADLHIQSKIFSDNILLCVEVGKNLKIEKFRIIIFMSLISEIQRKFIVGYRLFLRGGFTKGKMSVNEDYIFGEGLIDAVRIEESTFHPRIAVSDSVIKYLENVQIHSQEEVDKAALIESRVNNGEYISNEEQEFYQRILQMYNHELLARILALNLLYKCDDDVWCLSYLYCIDIRTFIPEQALKQVMEIMKQISYVDYEKLPKTFPNIDLILKEHKIIIEQKLIKHSDYSLFKTEDIHNFELQEKILKKYVWAMTYHNYVCDKYKKSDYHINSQGNCERRHMKLLIHVFDRDGRIKTTAK